MNWGRVVALLAGIARLGAAVLEYLNLPARRRAAAEKIVEREGASRRARAEADRSAAAEGDAAEVNRRLRELLPLAAACCLLAAGCARTVYVPAGRGVAPVSHEGRAGWFVPAETMGDLLQAAQRARDLEREMAVRARMEGK